MGARDNPEDAYGFSFTLKYNKKRNEEEIHIGSN